MAEPAEVLCELARVVRDELGSDVVVRPDASLRDDLALDSVSAVVVAVALEDRFRVVLHDEQVTELVTVGDLVSLVCRCVAEQRAGDSGQGEVA